MCRGYQAKNQGVCVCVCVCVCVRREILVYSTVSRAVFRIYILFMWIRIQSKISKRIRIQGDNRRWIYADLDPGLSVTKFW
jgi:hypothetical protein